MNNSKSLFIKIFKCDDENNNRFIVLDSLKGIAILGILLTHSQLVYSSGFVGKTALFGKRGVQMFFIISAMLTFYSIDSFKKKNNNKNIKKWYFNKFLRFIPIYYLSLIIYFFMYGFTQTYWAGNHTVNIFTYISNIFFLHGLNPWYINSININWYIGTLALFIILAPLIHKKVNNLQRSMVFFIITWIIALFCSYLTKNLYSGSDYYIWVTYWTTFSLISELPVLAVGIILYYLVYKEGIVENIKSNFSKRKNSKSITTLLTIIVLLLIYEKMSIGCSLVSCSILFGILIFIQLINSNLFINNKIFCFFGKYSYGIYLFHYLFTNWLSKLNFKYLSILHTYIIGVIFSIILSYICTNFIEKPIVSKFKKVI